MTHAYAAPAGTVRDAVNDNPKGFIDVRNMGVVFGSNDNEVVAVSDVSLNVKPGEFVSLIGPSGCGKSTLLSVVAGFVKPTRGEAILDGKPITRPGSDRGVVFQQYSLFPWLSVRKNVEFGLKMAGVDRYKRSTTARSLLDLAGLLSFENHYPDQLSGGMKQRIGIVRALATSPQVLLMDEPFGALDTQTRVVMQEILTNIWQQFRISVLFITHDIEESIFLSDRIYVMTARPGRIKAEIKVPLPRPRTPEMTDTPEFINLVQELKGLIREESLAAMAPEIKDRGLSGFGMKVGPKGVGELY
ncbi:sulfonate ABC transporter ATP-binding protein [Bradyrhizobium sp. CCBAU 051011]|uniref:ABC transporter ATP-binding protein n=1 Tax=Bradyrhizobium sp. CCBAU 051011 TaxID=858422 RepID=UPI00137444D6|nr:ABC transporter ATP-binding protein [Bradyrhizobium sp. CCBAU 051011]QHO74574.1 sulfonate ABC transporter ATP-binding protein [Bradyrhizobium sp. CCBAU 051011]